MSPSKLFQLTAAAVLAFAGSAQALEFRTATSGNWTSQGTWEYYDAGDDAWYPASFINTVPGAGDIVYVVNSDVLTVNTSPTIARLTVDASAQVSVSSSRTLTCNSGTSHIYGQLTVNNSSGGFGLDSAVLIVESGGTFNVVSGGIMNIYGHSPAMTVIGAFTLDGALQMGSITGAPVLEVQTSQAIPNSTSGVIEGFASSAAQPEIRITTSGGARTLTNNGLMQGRLTIKRGSGANNANFVNHYHVDANVAASLIFDSSLASVSDDTSNAVWQVSTNGSAVLQFNRGSATFSGAFNVLVSGGSLVVNDTISATSPANPLVYDLGSITVASGKNFYFSAGGGSCASQPTSPLSNTFYNTCP